MSTNELFNNELFIKKPPDAVGLSEQNFVVVVCNGVFRERGRR